MISIDNDFDDNDSSFTSISQRDVNSKMELKKPVNEVIPFKETFLNETFAVEKQDLKTHAASTELARGQAEVEKVMQQLQDSASKEQLNMKKFDEAAKDCVKSMKRSKNVFDTVYDDFTAIAAAAENVEASSNEFGAFLETVEDFFDLK